MGKINILKPNVFNMLAAGEVVERPSSVVKELMENSLDAGATEIYVSIERGGIGKIQVSDNGIGILKEDLKAAFMPHATSKLSTVDDLDSISTLGFRGEALASIASVSEVSLISASKSQGTAARISLSGGEITYEGEASRGEGTIITVENLFFNTPARLKFLKKPASEARTVLDVVRMLTLANPSISITLEDDGEVVLSHEGGTLRDAICDIYGIKTVDKLLELKGSDSGSIKVSGFISACDYTKPNRTYQTIIVNGRAVQDVTVQTAVERAYGDYLMKRAYPMFVLDIIMPFDEVDANVHPSKTEVRFLDKQKVFGAVYHAVQDTVNNSIGNITFGFDLSKGGKPTDDSVNISDNYATPLMRNDAGVVIPISAPSEVDNSSSDESVASYKANSGRESSSYDFSSATQTRIDTSKFYHGKTTPKAYDFDGFTPAYKGSLCDTGFSLEPHREVADVNADIENEPIGVFDGKIIGQAFSTYILIERDETLYIIDQHAAHERILYDRILDKLDSKYSQSLLMPYKLTPTGAEQEYIEEIMPQLSLFGFEIERHGAAYLITAVPEPIVDMSFEKFFGELFSNMLAKNELTLAGLLKEKLCQQACKAAIKGGESLSRAQLERVIKNYVDESGNLPTKCPHGRPAVIALNKRDLEKMFKRIV